MHFYTIHDDVESAIGDTGDVLAVRFLRLYLRRSGLFRRLSEVVYLRWSWFLNTSMQQDSPEVKCELPQNIGSKCNEAMETRAILIG